MKMLSIIWPSTLVMGIALLTTLSTPRARAAESPKPTGEIESLLNEAEGALLGRKSPRANAPAGKKKSESAPVPAPAPVEAKIEAPPQLQPIDTTAIQKVIEVDLEATRREREPLYPITLISLSVGTHGLNKGYSLSKDDDQFTNPEGGSLKGVYATFSPMWKIGALENHYFRPFVSVVFGAGFSQGDLLMQRSGVQSGDRNYAVRLFPIDAGLELNFEFFRRAALSLGYGPGVEIVHQAGAGRTDSITDVFYGDEAWIGINGRVSDSIRLFLQYKRKGVKVLLRSTSFGGNVLTAGMSFGLSG